MPSLSLSLMPPRRPRRPLQLARLVALAALLLGGATTGAARAGEGAPAVRAPAKAKGANKPKPREPGSKPGKPDEAVRRMLSGRYPNHSTAAPTESPQLLALRGVDRALFPPVKAPAGAPWALAFKAPAAQPQVDASGLPTTAPSAAPQPAPKPARDLSWVMALNKPDFPMRFDPAVVRYLEHYKNNQRGRALLNAFVRKSGRYRASLRKLLQQQKLPQDLMWLAMIESGFDAQIHSHAGAAGLWQFMPSTGRIYGLTVNRRVDERLDPERATMAAVRHLKDLYQRFGTWELAFAAYNMGYGGLMASVRKYNTNDYWMLRRLEAALPYETALYVPKIIALAVAANNCKVFGCDSVKADAALPFGGDDGGKIAVAPFVTLKEVAEACSVDEHTIEKLNPHVIGSRLPPLEQSSLPRKAWTVYVPASKAKTAAGKLPAQGARSRYAVHKLRWGESLEHVAHRYGTSLAWLRHYNDLERHQAPPAETVIFVPSGRKPKADAIVLKAAGKPVVVVPAARFHEPGRRRVFYRSVFGDTAEDVARVCGVSLAELRRWNQLDKRATLQSGMTLQLFLPAKVAPPNVLLLEEAGVTVLHQGSRAFFRHHIKLRGRERIEVVARPGDTLRSIAKRYRVSSRGLERINHRNRRRALKGGERIVVYVDRAVLQALRKADAKAADPQAAQAAPAPAPTPAAAPAPTPAAAPEPVKAKPPLPPLADEPDTDTFRDGDVPAEPTHPDAPDAERPPPGPRHGAGAAS